MKELESLIEGIMSLSRLDDSTDRERETMAATGQQMAYQCDQCGSSEIIALSLLYEQGTRSFSGQFTSGVSQSFAAKAASPPKAKMYFRPLVLWGPPFVILSFWIYAGVFFQSRSALRGGAVLIIVGLWLISIIGFILSMRKIARYNREVYPRLCYEWAHTFMCRRCGKYSLIRP